MKNYVVIGDMWKRAIVFLDENYADLYISKNCEGVFCRKYSEQEFNERYGKIAKTIQEYGLNVYNAQQLIILSSDC